MKRSLVIVMAVAAGVAVANNYYVQPLLPAIGKTFHLSSAGAGLIVTVSQLGYVLGLLLLTPLGDLRERRGLITTLAGFTAIGLVVIGLSPTWTLLYPAVFIVGAVSSLVQVIVPFSATLAPPEERGRVVGMVMTGLLFGILLARTVAGLLAQIGSWRTVYLVAAALMAIEAVVLHSALPQSREASELNYSGLLSSVFRLARHERLLQLRALYGLLSFAAFSALWTSLAFLLRQHYHYSIVVVGLFGLIGAGGALAASVVGRFSDKGLTEMLTGIAATTLVVAWIALWAGAHMLGWLIVGIVVLDIGAQGVHLTNQATIYGMERSLHSRLNSVYMVSYFIGGVLGSAGSATAYEMAGWDGVCIVGACFSAVLLVVWLLRALGRRWLPVRPDASAAAA